MLIKARSLDPKRRTGESLNQLTERSMEEAWWTRLTTPFEAIELPLCVKMNWQ